MGAGLGKTSGKETWNKMEWIAQGLPPPTPTLGCLRGGRGDSSFLWSSYCRGMWGGGLPSPPQPQNFSGLFLPFGPAKPGAWAPLMQEGPLCLKRTLAKARGWGGECHWRGPGCSVAALMAREDVEVAVSPRVVGGNALQDDVSGRARGAEVSKAGWRLGTSVWPQGHLRGRSGPTCGPQVPGRLLSHL